MYRMKVLGDEHSDVLDSMDNLAIIRKSTAEKGKLSGRCDCIAFFGGDRVNSFLRMLLSHIRSLITE
jgi:hypothetical protein